MTARRVLRAALTQTANVHAGLPRTIEELPALAGRLEEVRRANVEHHVDLIGRAADRGARLVGLGELFAGPYFALSADPMWLSLAEDAASGPTVVRLREVARSRGVVIVAPIYELAPDGRRFNTAVVIDERGEVLGKYRKTHIPHGHNEQGAFLERAYYEPGDGEGGVFFPVFATSLVRIGVAICYDRHFEGVMSTLAGAGAELVLCPSVTFGQKSRRLWDFEFQVDAARHRVHIGGSNRKGTEPPWNQRFFGESHFCSPDGRLPDLSDHHELVIADLDLDMLAGPDPSGWNLARDARPEIYSPRGRGPR